MSNNVGIEQLTIDRAAKKQLPSFNSLTGKFILLVLLFLSAYFAFQAKSQLNKTASETSHEQVTLSVKEPPQTEQLHSSESIYNININTTPNINNSVLDASGHIVARRIATVSSRVTGKLKRLNIEEGQRVVKLQILAELDDKQAQISYKLALAELSAKQARFAEIKIVQQHELKRLKRHLSLFEKSLISEQLVDDSRFSTDKTSAQLNNIKSLIVLTTQKVELAKYQLSQHKIRAPFDGVVISKNAQVGELISAGSSGGGFIRTGVGTIVDMSSLEIEVEVGESYINRVYQGQKTIAILDAYPRWKIASEVVAVIPTANRQKASIRVRVKLFSIDSKILPDMGVKVSFLARN
ncbi:MAG: efflux RND transporter periplasmic adaptor subunit [Colwellia sp.]